MKDIPGKSLLYRYEALRCLQIAGKKQNIESELFINGGMVEWIKAWKDNLIPDQNQYVMQRDTNRLDKQKEISLNNN